MQQGKGNLLDKGLWVRKQGEMEAGLEVGLCDTGVKREGLKCVRGLGPGCK